MTDYDDRPSMSRRELLRVLGWGVGAGVVGGARILSAAKTATARPRRPVGGGPGQERPIIRTLLGDLAPDELGDGAVLFHEHLSMHYPPRAKTHFTDDVDLMIDEVKAARARGVSAIVDAGHPDMSRNLDALRRIAREASMPVVASGGYYMQSTYPSELARQSADEIAENLAAEAARDGLGAFGEIGQEGGVLTAEERKVFQAVGKAHLLTGLPVFTHNAYSIRSPDVPREAALRQLDVFEGVGVKPERVAIGHVCCLDDPKAEIAIRLAERGAFVGFDRVELNYYMPDAKRVSMAMAMIEAGHAEHLLLSSDFASSRALRKNGGPGLAETLTVFAPMLLKAGLPEATLHRILVDNPKRFLAFTPRA